MKLEKEFNEYLADMAVLSIKISNLHWNVVGKNFLAVHKYTEAEYEKAQERMDEVAELIRMFGLVPASTMAEYLQLAHVKEVPSKQYTCAEVWTPCCLTLSSFVRLLPTCVTLLTKKAGSAPLICLRIM